MSFCPGGGSRERLPDGAFARELARLHYGGVPPSRVIASLAKGNERDHAWGKDLIWAIEHFMISTGEARDERVRRVDSEEGRRLTGAVLQIIGLMKRGKGARCNEIRLDGPNGFWGRAEKPQSSQAHRERKRLPMRPGSKLRKLMPGEPRLYSSRRKAKRLYCPKGQTGGLAERFGVTPRTVGYWAAVFRNAGFLGCKQPPRDKEDAVLSRRQGDYPYGIWRILRALPSKMMQRLQLFWGELQKPAEQREAEALRRSEAASQHRLEQIEHSRIRAECGHERAPPRKRRSEVQREQMRWKQAELELVRKESR